MTTRTTIAAGIVAAAIAGGGAGAAVYAVAGGGTRTVTTEVATPAPSQVARTSGSLSVSALYAAAVPGIVEVDSTVPASQTGAPGFGFGFGGGGNAAPSSTAQGTGFVIDTAGHIVTNEHVISGATSVHVKLRDGTTYTAKVVGSDPSTDIAVLKIDAPASELHPLALGDSSAVQVGDGVVAIGDPFGLDDTVTTGIVSAVNREITAPDNSPIEGAIQTDAAINHGNSGGPLFDLQGKVIGITAQIESDSGGNDGVGFAIPSNLVRTISAQLIKSGSIQHPLLGIEAETLPAAVAKELGEAAGVAVASVEPGSGAQKAGLKAGTAATVQGQQYPVGGDVITAVDGRKIATSQDLRAAIEKHKVGETITLTVVRQGQTRTVHAKLGSR